MGYTILITGASGFLGSALCAGLARHHRVIGLFRRPPGKTLLAESPGVQWEKSEIADQDCLDWIFKQSAARGRPVDYVIHFAAYTGFGEKWKEEYSITNVIGTRNVIEASCNAGVKRILFAGSIAALEPLPRGQSLTEKSRARGRVAYARSKALGEELFHKNRERIPVAVLRLGGVFTDWCELPPLYSVMKLWSHPVLGRLMPGQGFSGFPYIHRRDVVDMVGKVLENIESLGRFEVLFASPDGCTCQKELFPIIRQALNKGTSPPIHLSLPLARMALHGKFIFNTLMGQKTYERAWMIDYADRPLKVDTSYSREKLAWAPRSDLQIIKRMPLLVERFKNSYVQWNYRNIIRNDQKYEYAAD